MAIFRKTAYQLFFSIKKVTRDWLISYSSAVYHYVTFEMGPLHTGKLTLFLSILSFDALMLIISEGERMEVNVGWGPWSVYLLVCYTHNQSLVQSWIEITNLHLTECPLTDPCVSIQNKQIILRWPGTFLLIFVCVCLCVCTSGCVQACIHMAS